LSAEGAARSNGAVPFDAMSFDPRTSFGPAVAATYDDTPRGDEAAAVARLAELAGDGPALELAVGTGRIALPLAATGLRVDGVELSQAMIDQLRARPGGDALAVTCGDMAVVELPDRYRLVYVVFNSLMNLVTQDEQVECVANAARHLADDGVFVVENVVPDPMYGLRHDRDGVDQYVDAEHIGPDGVTVEVGRFDRVTQRVDKCHVGLSGGGVRLDPLALRYVWPSELDLMARLAGLRLRDRWGGWSGEPFDGRSLRHVSVYGR
jgi:SAM-dependent methyltransferase